MLQNDLQVNGCAASRADVDRIEDALSFIDPDLPRDDWWKILAGIKSELGEAGRDLALQWSRGGDSFEPGALDDTWRSCKPGGGISIATVFFMAKEAGWTDSAPRPKLTAEQIKARQMAQEQAAKEAEAEAKAAQARTAEQAAAIWQQADPADPAHRYLERKKAKPTATMRQMDAGELAKVLGYQPKCGDEFLSGAILALGVRRVGQEDLCTLELIDQVGRKAALRGQGTKSRAFWPTIHPLPAETDELLVGEGGVTVLSAAEATGLPAVAALSASNLRGVAEDLRSIYPNTRITILADLDKKTGKAMPQAAEAAKAVGGFLAIPGFGPERLEGQTDFNDLSVLAGSEAVRAAIEGAQAPLATEPKNPPTPSGPIWPEFIPFEQLPPDLPEGLLPGILGEFTEGIAEAVQAPRELAAINALGVTALCVQNKVLVRVKPDYKETLNIFAGCASEAGERKSGLMSAAKAPVMEWEREQEEKMMQDILAAVSTRKTLEKVIEKARAKAAGAKTADEAKEEARKIYEMECALPTVPARPRLLVDDITPEALAAVMATSGESIGMLEPEGGALDTFAGRYSNSVPNIDILLKSFCGEEVIVDRKGKDPLRLRQPRLTMILTPQPAVLKAAGTNKAFMERGLIARCILLLPRPRVGYRDNSKTVDRVLVEQWRKFVRYLLDEIPQGQSEISLSPAAYGQWLEFSEEVEIKQRPGGEFEHIKSWASKLTGLVARIAGLFHLAEGHSESGEISSATMDQACRFAWWAAEHAKYVYSSFGVDEGQDGAKRILEWIQKKQRESITAREIYKALRGRYQKMEQLRPGLDMLVERGAIVPGCKSPASPRGGRPTESYLVNPSIYTQ